ncbi:uncharacterized protein M421DRAFT_9155 [Didymella exigua CBS 183.55]|uniref:Uncharacterized protein n=1 Tax=Didymella exigua CBS 183.55 TaxID=1150837 RepID=A0A6A5RE76_9PLEO|nr:uncharacterized protein M421DRAFT_9155 [Didymella exigua CBS 183.55]KAF1924007.1 hypothetical protein M421DRAFT_9155 [Didymella exigua CBS 183.55]
MRGNFSSPTLSPLPPYSANAPPKGPVLPATAPPSPELPLIGVTIPVQEIEDMRATHIRPRTAPASPERPGTAVSTRSTIRQVQPSPDSLINAFANGFADGGTPGPDRAPEPSFEPFPPFNSAEKEDTADDDHGTHIPSTEPTLPNVTLRRGGSPRKSRSYSPQKSRSESPRKHMVRTPILPVHQESPSSSYSAERWEVPDTPSPVTREQHKQAYAPLQVRRPIAEANREGEPAGGQGTQARIADYVRKAKKQQRGEKSKSSDAGPSRDAEGSEPTNRVVPALPHIVSAMAQPSDTRQTLSPFSVAQRRAQTNMEKGPARHTSVSRRSEASGASVASRHSIFSTPGRDEMERKKPIIEEDEGPFAKAMSVRDLEQSRRRVREGTRDEEEKSERRSTSHNDMDPGIICTRPALMLHDVAVNCRRISATLPPDGWNDSEYTLQQS